MKISATILALSTVLFSLTSAASSPKLISVDPCTPGADSEIHSVRYVPQASGEVIAILTVIEWTGLAAPAAAEGAPSFSEIATGPIAGLALENDQIIDNESGAVCGKLKKPFLADAKFSGTKACKLAMETEWKRTSSGAQCTLSTYLTVK